MNTIKIEAYTYSELSDKAKKKVQYWLNEDMQLWDKYTEQQWRDDLAKLGYEDVDMQYRGFYSQGDGASIACSVDVEQFIKRHKYGNRFRGLLNFIRKHGMSSYVEVVRERWGNYVHDKLLRHNVDDLAWDIGRYEDDEEYGKSASKALAQLEEIAPLILEEVQEKSRELYEYLQADYEWHFTDEYMVDMCDSNEYLFNVYGEPVHHLEVEMELA